MVKNYSLKKDGAKYLSDNFKVSEFRSKDGVDTVLVDDSLVELLQAIRDRFGKPVIINSGYRTPAHDKKVGGSGSGYHTKGMAADISVTGVRSLTVAAYAQTLLGGTGGVECAAYASGGYVHVDVRGGKWRAVMANSNGKYQSVSTLFPTVKNGKRSQSVTILQRELAKLGYAVGSADGICGAKTVAAIKAFQKDRGLSPDGICGKKTWEALCEL